MPDEERTADQQMQLDSAKLWLATSIAGAEVPLDQLVEWIRCFHGVPGGIRELSAYLAELLDEHARAAASGPPDGVNDRLDAAFAALDELGILALHHAGSTQSDGWTAAWERAEGRTSPARGVTFYHAQDIDNAVAGRPLYHPREPTSSSRGSSVR